MMLLTAVLALTISLSSGQLYYHSIPLGYQSHNNQYQQPLAAPAPAPSLAHPAVVENAIRESQYPAEYTNKFYKDPRIAAALAKESWFTDKESPVFDREAEKIPREQVFKLFKNAGWIKRR